MGLLNALWREVGRGFGHDRTPRTAEQALTAINESLREDKLSRAEALRQLSTLRVQHARNPDIPSRIGDLLLAQGQLADAEQRFREALSLQPEHARAQEGLGLTLLQQGRAEPAFLHFETAHKLAPMNAEVLVHWGLADLSLGNIAPASQKFMKAIERDPANAHAWQNLGLTSYRMGRFANSVAQLRRAVELNPAYGLAWSNLALSLRQSNDLVGALAAAEQATALKSDNARVWVVLGDLCADAGQFDRASQAFDRALTLDPAQASTFIGQAKLLMAQGRYDDSRAAYGRALQLEPDQADAQAGLGQLHLLQQQWEPGWRLYEARHRTVDVPVRPVSGLRWDGEALGQRKLLIHAEQGLGDIILFSSCLPDLIEQGVHCIIDVPQRLGSLFQRSFPQAQVHAHDPAQDNAAWQQGLPAFDLHIPMGSLPRLLRRRAEDFPNRHAFLTPDPARVNHWRQQLASLPGPRIGIAWRGGLAGTAGAQRSLALAQLLGALCEVESSLVCLQYGPIEQELNAAQEQRAVHPGLSGFGDLDDLAALTTALDGVITVCSTQAHLCGALGVPAVVLVPSNPSWRYGHEGSHSPWYPSLTLVRQSKPGDWQTPLENAAEWVRRRTFATATDT